MQAAQDRQKSYADRKRKPMEFEVGDRVMLKVSPWKGVVRFGKIHHTFHIQIKRNDTPTAPLVMPLEGIHVDDKLQFVEEPVKTMEGGNQTIEGKAGYHWLRFARTTGGALSFTWEREDSFKQKYPQLFTNLHRHPLQVLSFEGQSSF
ncbi:hypothetical protein Tco_0529825 [Tanacetum coccineum]